MDQTLNVLIDDFVFTFNNDLKQRDINWSKLMGVTVGGSEIAAITGLSPYSDFYKIVESKIEICKGNNIYISNISCSWGNVFENVITKVVEIDLGNNVKGANICIQKIEGHRNSPDGYIVLHLYKKDEKYQIWTTNLNKDLIELSIIVLLEFKCPISRKVTGDIPKYYKPQVLSGLAVSPIASKGLYVEGVFKKCSIKQLELNYEIDTDFHKTKMNTLPIAYGIIPIYMDKYNIINNCTKFYEYVFDKKYSIDTNNIIDLGSISGDMFGSIMLLIDEFKLTMKTSTVKFFDSRGDTDVYNFNIDNNKVLFAFLPWKLFDLSYIPIDREPNFLESIYPIIQRVHKCVQDSLLGSYTIEQIKIMDICDKIYG